MHAGLPMIPFDPQQMQVQAHQPTPPGVPAGAVPKPPAAAADGAAKA
jgi:hypothetical protein